jgi:hypothetical protein
LHGAAARLYTDAMRRAPKLAEGLAAGHRYNAACAAALAGAGQGKDQPPLDEDAKRRLRLKATAWLQADLDAWTTILDRGSADLKARLVPVLRHWKEDSDLAGVRDEVELAKLPEAERSACRNLWADVDELLRRARVSAGRVGTLSGQLPVKVFAP